MSFLFKGKKTPPTDAKNEMIKYAKNPELFKDFAQSRNEENEKFQEHKRKLKNLQDSRRNMRVDMRPKVVAKIMSKELILFFFALIAAIGMPLYFYKLQKLKEDYSDYHQTKLLEKSEQQLSTTRNRSSQSN